MSKEKMTEFQALKCKWTEMPHTELVDVCAKLHKQLKGEITKCKNQGTQLQECNHVLRKLEANPAYVKRILKEVRILRDPFDRLRKSEEDISAKSFQLKRKEKEILKQLEELARESQKLELKEQLSGAVMQTLTVYSKNGLTVVHTKSYNVDLLRGRFFFVNDKYEWKRLNGVKSVEIQGRKFEYDEETQETEIVEGDPDFVKPQSIEYKVGDDGRPLKPMPVL